MILFVIIKINQGTNDSKDEFLNTIEMFEDLGYKVFDIGCYNIDKKLAEAILIKDRR